MGYYINPLQQPHGKVRLSSPLQRKGRQGSQREGLAQALTVNLGAPELSVVVEAN